MTETAPAPAVRERVVTQPAVSAYAYPVGSRVTDAYALAPMPQSVVATVPAVRSYRYMVINNRLLLVDPATGYRRGRSHGIADRDRPGAWFRRTCATCTTLGRLCPWTTVGE